MRNILKCSLFYCLSLANYAMASSGEGVKQDCHGKSLSISSTITLLSWRIVSFDWISLGWL